MCHCEKMERGYAFCMYTHARTRTCGHCVTVNHTDSKAHLSFVYGGAIRMDPTRIELFASQEHPFLLTICHDKKKGWGRGALNGVREGRLEGTVEGEG